MDISLADATTPHLRIAVNGLPLMAVQTGIARYLKSLYAQINTCGEVEVSYVTLGKHLSLAPSGAQQGGRLDTILSLHPKIVYAMRVCQWVAYEKYLGYLARQRKMDIVHESFYTPSKIGGSVRQVFTLHDLSLVKYPHTHSLDRRLFFDRFFLPRLHEADHIIVPSEFVKQELCEFSSFGEKDITVISEGVGDQFAPCSGTLVERTLSEMGLPSEYLLFVGTLEPRKNLTTLLKALSQAECDMPLVIIGWSGWGDAEFQNEMHRLGLEDRVFFPGYLSDDQLVVMYNGATAFLYPSLYEGFGLPVLEAMACGCPVICSNAASIPEVAGNAAVFASPLAPEEWAEAIDKVVGDSDLRNSLSRLGKKRASTLSWQSAAEQTLKLFTRLI